MSARDLIVQVAGNGGIESETSCTDFAHALTVCRVMGHAHPSKYVWLFDRGGVDVSIGEFDGLTEDERDASRDVVIAAQALGSAEKGSGQ